LTFQFSVRGTWIEVTNCMRNSGGVPRHKATNPAILDVVVGPLVGRMAATPPLKRPAERLSSSQSAWSSGPPFRSENLLPDPFRMNVFPRSVHFSARNEKRWARPDPFLVARRPAMDVTLFARPRPPAATRFSTSKYGSALISRSSNRSDARPRNHQILPSRFTAGENPLLARARGPSASARQAGYFTFLLLFTFTYFSVLQLANALFYWALGDTWWSGSSSPSSLRGRDFHSFHS